MYVGTYVVLSALLNLWQEVRRTTPTGLERLRTMDPAAARAVQDSYMPRPRRRVAWARVAGVLGLGLSWSILDPERALGYDAGCLAWIAAGAAHRQAAPRVLAVLAPRRLPALPPATREVSARRRRRVVQFGTAILGLALLGESLVLLGHHTSWSRLVVPGVACFVGCGLLALGFVWAAGWRYGDERTVTASAHTQPDLPTKA